MDIPYTIQLTEAQYAALLRRAAEKGVNLLGTELDTFAAAHRLAGMLSP